MNTTENITGFKSLIAAAAIVEGQRIKVTSGQADIAAATDSAIGVAIEAAASGTPVTVKLWSAPGTFIIRAAGAISAGTQVFPAASGNIAGTGTTALNVINLEAATGANDLIECAVIQKGA